MLSKVAFMFWTWGRAKTINHITKAYKTLGVAPSFNSRSHSGSDGRVLKLEPLTAVHVFNKKIKLGEWEDFDKIGDGYPKDSKYARGFEAGWFGPETFQFKHLKKFKFGYLDGYFLRKTLKRT